MNEIEQNQSLTGGCGCGAVRYRLEAPPLFVHCCHCSWCQRESGSAFAVNALIETSRIATLADSPAPVDTPSASGKGQKILRCPQCRIAVWSHYAGAGDRIAFVRVGTLDPGHDIEPDIHIFTSTKHSWVVLPANKPSVSEYYNRSDYWPQAAMLRRDAALAKS